MPLEDLEGPNKFLDALVITNPLQTDQGLDLGGHARGIKNVLINTFGQLDAAFNAFDVAHPVGSVFLSVALDPNTLAGTWSQIAQGRMLIGAGTLASDTYLEGDTGGSARHTLTEAEMPPHDHPETSVSSANDGTNAGGQYRAQAAGGTTGSTGGGGAHENRPPYLAVTIWQRTA